MLQITPRLPHHKRKEIIKDYIASETTGEIAQRCGCTRQTITRDITLMKQTGEWGEFLERAMFHYGRLTTVSDEAKFKEYAKLYGKQFITTKTNAVVSGGVAPIIVKMWMPDSDESTTDDSNTV